ncbi:GNAT family N-acetyltransferase [Nocardia suismassiliense]|uniref:GNAT family N-acetyltransferase n=1 Tax=Nocardia suismassiliense TaxID=2077092 RepID=A0ABW6QS95_9NOCA
MSKKAVEVEVVESVSEELLTAVTGLVPQLSTSAPPLTRAQLNAIVASPATHLVTARIDRVMVGVMTLVMYPIPTGLRARIEDVVVDRSARGHGVGRAMTLAALDIAKLHNARTVDLTSRPSREAANGLYRSLGFEPRDSMTYRLTL